MSDDTTGPSAEVAGALRDDAVSDETTGLSAEEARSIPDDAMTTDDAGGASTTEGTQRRRVRRPPEQTRDDTDAGWGERSEQSAHDRWLQEQRPPHYE